MNRQWMCIFILTGTVLSLQAQNPVLFEDTQSALLRYTMVGLNQTDSGQSGFSASIDTTHLKKPGRGALFSAAIPGAGQMYGDAWIKGAIYLGAEIGLWFGYVTFYNEGVDMRNQFHDYADAHWSEARYWVSIANDAAIQGVTEDNYSNYLEELRAYEHAEHHHTLPEEKIQQYFEVIGKYDFFAVGWEDYDVNKPELTPLRNTYENMRNSSNVEFKRASTCAMVVMANHLISSLDAAWTISKQNREIRVAMHVDLKPIRDELMPLYGFQVDW